MHCKSKLFSVFSKLHSFLKRIWIRACRINLRCKEWKITSNYLGGSMATITKNWEKMCLNMHLSTRHFLLKFIFALDCPLSTFCKLERQIILEVIECWINNYQVNWVLTFFHLLNCDSLTVITDIYWILMEFLCW